MKINLKTAGTLDFQLGVRMKESRIGLPTAMESLLAKDEDLDLESVGKNQEKDLRTLDVKGLIEEKGLGRDQKKEIAEKEIKGSKEVGRNVLMEGDDKNCKENKT